MKKIFFFWTIISVFLSSPGATQDKKINVVASFSILADLVREIGQEHVEVTSIVGPNSDAHTFQPTPDTGKLLTHADILFINGLGFEGWMTRLIDSCGFRGPVITVSQGIKPLYLQENIDPHAWHTLENGEIYLTRIAEALSAHDPSSAVSYKKNLKHMVKKLRHLEAWVHAELKEIPVEKRKVITAHDAFGYFGKAYGIEFLAPLGLSTEAEPSAKDMAKLIEQIKKHKIKALFIENITNQKILDPLLIEAGTTLGGTLYSDALSEKDGPASTYIQMITHNVLTLKKEMIKK